MDKRSKRSLAGELRKQWFSGRVPCRTSIGEPFGCVDAGVLPKNQLLGLKPPPSGESRV